MVPTVRRMLCGSVVVLTLAGCGGCNPDPLLHQTASFGGDTAGQRGTADVLFINNTPFRAIFTFGAYDDMNEDAQPQLLSFGPNGVPPQNLEGNAFSARLPVTCARVFSVGGDTMRRLAEENLDPSAILEEALVPGVLFSSAAIGEENEALPTEGTADPLDLWLGADFPCGCLIVFRFEVNDVGDTPFRIDYEVFPDREAR